MVGMPTNQKTLLVTDARLAGGAWRRCLADVRVWSGHSGTMFPAERGAPMGQKSPAAVVTGAVQMFLGGRNKINLETSGIITQLFTLPGAAQNETKHPHEPFLVVQCSNTPN